MPTRTSLQLVNKISLEWEFIAWLLEPTTDWVKTFDKAADPKIPTKRFSANPLVRRTLDKPSCKWLFLIKSRSLFFQTTSSLNYVTIGTPFFGATKQLLYFTILESIERDLISGNSEIWKEERVFERPFKISLSRMGAKSSFEEE